MQSGESAMSAVSAKTIHERKDRVVELFLELRAGKRDRVDEFVVELSPLLWQVARAQGLDPLSSQDVVQTTWLQFLRDIDRIHTPAAVIGWLVTTTKREAWRVRSASRVTESLDGRDLPDESVTPEESAVLDDQHRRLWATVSQLSERCQALLRVVAFVQRPNYTALGDALRMPRGGVGPTRGRCLAQLRALLAADPDGSWR